MFESFCFILFVRYYEEAGYVLKPENLLEGKFRFKYNTKGYPWNYSYFVAHSTNGTELSAALFEIRHNQQVSSAWIKANGLHGDKPPVFAVDIAVVKPDGLPKLKRGQARKTQQYWAGNQSLITFGESKKLTAYPMLLAQFLGIVHEIKPEFLNSKTGDFRVVEHEQHPFPVLFTSGNLTEGTEKVLKSFQERNYLITVIDNVITAPEATLLSKFSKLPRASAKPPTEDSASDKELELIF